jgi:solute carrier family 34 (sodium-dependent phosphate cotransporter)
MDEHSDPPADAAAHAPRAARFLTRKERFARLLLLFALLYAFLVAIDVLGTGIADLGPGVTDELFRGIDRPVIGLLAGIFATVLAQSSSVTTATVVGMVGTGVIGLGDAVFVVMGANIGTTITNTLASIGSIRRTEEFRRAFTGATMHDVFNVASVAILVPLEITTRALSRLAVLLSEPFGDVATGEYRSPAKELVAWATELLERAAFAIGGETIIAPVLLIVVALALIFGTLFGITRNMRTVIAGPAERSLNAVLGRAGSLGIIVGVVLTVAVQSSSIATSLLIPMIAAGVLSLENAYPITLGANVGTTITALLAALAVDRIEGLQIAFVHLLFNCAGIVIFYPLPFLRRVPLRVARRLGDFAARRRVTALIYIVFGFYVIPLLGILLLR